MNFNKAIIVGRLTQDPETRSLPSGQNVASFSVATNRVWSDQSGNRQESTEFHNISAFGKLGDICSRYLNKGQLILIEGRLQTRSWQDQQGTKKYRTEIIAENMQMGPRAGSANSSSETPSSNQNQAEPRNESQESASATSQDDIPVIETEESPVSENNNNSQEQNKNQNSDQEKIDVKDIPF